MTTLCSYDISGKKLSFANWISNLSPQETPFVSMTGKESINQTLFQWQTDALSKAGRNAAIEGDEAKEAILRTTSIKQNITQILRKTVKVSDTANALANYGRGRELQYQMEKAGKEIKRDLEWTFMHNVGSRDEATGGTTGRETAGFRGLVAGFGVPCPETGAVVHAETKNFDTAATTKLTEKSLFKMTYNLYLAGSMADIIMFHPAHASFFSGLQEVAGGQRQRIFEDTPKFSVYVSNIIDPLGQQYKLIPNRWMPEGVVYFFNSRDWTQMVLRAPSRTKLAKDGSYEKWMIEMEVGLRHRHPYASGVLTISTTTAADDIHSTSNTNALDGTNKTAKLKGDKAWDAIPVSGASSAKEVDASSAVAKPLVLEKGAKLTLSAKLTSAAGTNKYPNTISVLKDGKEVVGVTKSDGTAADMAADTVILSSASPKDAGIYSVEVASFKANAQGEIVRHVYQSYGVAVHVTAGVDKPIASPVSA